MVNFDLKSEIQKLAQNTQFKVEKAIKRYKLNTSTNETVLIDIEQLNELSFKITFDFRGSLKFQDQGVGSGWKKGVRLNQDTYAAAIASRKTGRKQKRIVNRKIYWMINSLKDFFGPAIVQETLSSFTVNITTPNVQHIHIN